MMRIAVALCLLTASCSEISGLVTPLPSDALNSSSTITVKGIPVALSAAVTRDPQLHFSGMLYTTSLAVWPSGASAGRVWVIDHNVAWVADTHPDTRPIPIRIGAILVLASPGPSWRLGDSVDVVMEVHDGTGGTQFVRAPRVAITAN